jgi:hypothetical protein
MPTVICVEPDGVLFLGARERRAPDRPAIREIPGPHSADDEFGVFIDAARCGTA